MSADASQANNAEICDACSKDVANADETYIRLVFGPTKKPGLLVLCRDCFAAVSKLTVEVQLVDPRPPKPTPGGVYGFEQNLDPIVHIETVSPSEMYGGRVYSIGTTRITLRTKSGINIPVVGMDGIEALTVQEDAFPAQPPLRWLVYTDLNGKRIGHPLDPNYTSKRVEAPPYW